MNRSIQRLLSLLPMAPLGFAIALSQGSVVKDSLLGMSFTAPNGWKSQHTEGGYIMTSEKTPGYLVMLPHDRHSLDDLRQDAAAGVNEGEEMQLSLVGEVKDFGKNGVSAEYEGLINGAPARAHAVGLISPHGGGVTIISAAEQSAFSDALVRLAEQVARSIMFHKPETANLITTWEEQLTGKKLTYLSSYNSGPSGGYSAKRVLSLCANHRFILSTNSVVSIDLPDAAGNSGGINRSEGRWEIAVASGHPVLRLHFADGSQLQYLLGFQEGKLHLDGTRYFLTGDPECE
jgi:hypothetical protein